MALAPFWERSKCIDKLFAGFMGFGQILRVFVNIAFKIEMTV